MERCEQNVEQHEITTKNKRLERWGANFIPYWIGHRDKNIIAHLQVTSPSAVAFISL